jgi:hypothetical protein
MSNLLDSPIRRVHNLREGYSFRPDHIEKRWFFYREQIWHFEINKKDPLVIELDNDVCIMPDYSFDTNLGSIPIPLRIIFPKDEFPLEYALHDDEYNRHGIFVRWPGAKSFVFVSTDRAGADRRLRKNILFISQAKKPRAEDIYLGVRIGGGIPWKMGAPRERKLQGVELC